MPRRILLIQGHPDPDPERLCRGLAHAYAQGAQAGGHVVELLDLAHVAVPLLPSQAAYRSEALPPSLNRAKAALERADHVVLVFPLWLGTMPALVKAFLEQVMRPGVAFTYQEKGFPKVLLAGRSARVVVTMGMPAWLYRWYYFSHGIRGLVRNVLRFVGLGPVRTSLFGSVDTASARTRARWLARMHDLGTRGR